MNYQTEAQLRVRSPIVPLSDDSYIRLTLETFLAIPLVHLLSGLDDDEAILPREGASLTHISGYTEWVSATTPTITLGWDWGLDVSPGQVHYVRLCSPRSNIMLVDAVQHDLGPTRTSILLETAIDALAWQEEIYKYIAARYAW